MGPTFRETVKSLAEPAILYDVKDLLKGRVLWRRVANSSEILSRFLAAVSTVLAYSASVEIENTQRVDGEGNPSFATASALSFTAGVSGSVALVLNVLAAWGRGQAIERNEALNSILRKGRIQEVPSVMQFESVGDQPSPTQASLEEEEEEEV